MLGGLNNLYRMSLLLTADVRGFTAGVTRAETRLAKFSQRATAFGRSSARGLGLAFGFIGASAVSAAAEFDRANAILEQIVGTAGIKRLTDQAKELGRTSVFMATDIAKAQLEIAKLGVQGEALERVLVKAKDVATIFGTEVDKTGGTILSTMRQFGLAVDDTEEGVAGVANTADIMAAAFKNSALDLNSFREAMKNVGPTAKAAGLDMVQTTARLAVLANAAVKGSLGGTKLRSALSDLAKDFPDAAEALKRLEAGTLSYSEILELLNKRAALVGQVLSDNSDEIRDFEAILYNATGTVDAMADGLQDRLFFQVERVKNAFQSLGISIGEGLTPIVNELADFVEKLAIAFDDMDPKQIEEIGRGILFFLEAATVAFVGGKILGLIGGLVNGWRKLNEAVHVGGGLFINFGQTLKVLGGPILAVSGLILGVGEAVEYAFSEERILKHNAQLRKTKEEYDRIKDSVEDLRRAEDLRLRDERKLPSQGAAQLEDFLKIDPVEDSKSLLKVLDELLLFEQIYAERAKEIQRISGLITYGIKNGLDVEGLQIDRNQLISFQTDTKTYIDAYKRYLDFISGKSVENPFTSSDINSDGKVAGTLLDVPMRFGEQGVIDKTIDDLDRILRVQQGIQDLPKVGEQGVFIFDEDKTEAQAIAISKAAVAINEYSDSLKKLAEDTKGLKGTASNAKAVTDAIDDAVEESRIKAIKAAGDDLFSFLQNQLDFLGQAFLQASESGERFFDVLLESLETTFKQIMAKLITLIAAYATLALLSTGEGGLAQASSSAMGEGFGAFLANGFGLPEFIGAGGTGSNPAEQNVGEVKVSVEGAVSGSNLVIMNKRGTHAFDRTFG